MQPQRNILKAGILLFAFTLNTVVSFACSLGVDFNFYKDHHTHDTQEEKEITHSHPGAGLHTHSEKHHHNEPSNDHQHKETKDQENCCSDEIVKLTSLDKKVAENISEKNLLPAFVAAVHIFLLPDYLVEVNTTRAGPPFKRSWHLTNHTDIRIEIQSFQI